MARLMVLGMLRTKPMSGYELQQLLQMSGVEVWAGILPGSIYHALKKMDKEGLVKVAQVETTGHRVKAIYEITEEGEKEYKKLLIDSFRESSVQLPVQLYTGLSMLSLPNPEVEISEVAAAIEEQMRELKKRIEELQKGQEIKSQYVEANDLMAITFEHMINEYQLQLCFLEKILKAI